jgi:hypothetical protein
MEPEITAYVGTNGSVRIVEKGQPQEVKIAHKKPSKETYLHWINGLNEAIANQTIGYLKESLQERLEDTIQMMNEDYPN